MNVLSSATAPERDDVARRGCGGRPPPASSGRCDDPKAEPFHLRTITRRLVAHGVVGPDLAPDLVREPGEREDVRAGGVEVFGDAEQLLGYGVEDAVELGVHGGGVGLVVNPSAAAPAPRPAGLSGWRPSDSPPQAHIQGQVEDCVLQRRPDPSAQRGRAPGSARPPEGPARQGRWHFQPRNRTDRRPGDEVGLSSRRRDESLLGVPVTVQARRQATAQRPKGLDRHRVLEHRRSGDARRDPQPHDRPKPQLATDKRLLLVPPELQLGASRLLQATRRDTKRRPSQAA